MLLWPDPKTCPEQEEDRLAYAIFKKQFPEHEVIQLDTEVIHYGGGNIHCITQQQPKV
jgi:agmatine deiminase